MNIQEQIKEFKEDWEHIIPAVLFEGEQAIIDKEKEHIKSILEGLVERKKDLLERCTECENREIHEENPNNKLHIADISHLQYLIKSLDDK